MIKRTDILTAINRLLVEKYPNTPIYIQSCPKDFLRPSIMLETVRISPRDVTHSSVEKTVYITITCFTEEDKYSRLNQEELANMQDSIIEFFSRGYVVVNDRAIKVQSSTGGMNEDEAYIDLQFEFFDNRTDDEEQDPIATSVTTRLEGGKT